MVSSLSRSQASKMGLSKKKMKMGKVSHHQKMNAKMAKKMNAKMAKMNSNFNPGFSMHPQYHCYPVYMDPMQQKMLRKMQSKMGDGMQQKMLRKMQSKMGDGMQQKMLRKMQSKMSNGKSMVHKTRKMYNNRKSSRKKRSRRKSQSKK